MKPKSIPKPEFESAKKLTPLELNSLQYENKHTLLTPEVLASLGSRQ